MSRGRAGGGPIEDVHERVARRFQAERLAPVLDIGSGTGALARALEPLGVPWVGVDLSPTLVSEGPRPALRASAAALPFGEGTFGAAAALYVLYQLEDPAAAVAEAHRVLRRGGLFAVAAPSRRDSPEIAHLIPSGTPPIFDAEVAPDLIGEVFEEVEVLRWDGPHLRLPDRAALEDYLRFHLWLPPEGALPEELGVDFPLRVTRSGALVLGCRRS